ncbi:hypothetical protein M8C21_029314 [Ambrosia artemisiifolia]|uniref:Uncharacterized protein n=1 Tax=Ambrosia artemisiifolia TaxID=4212 RepID=A0AAD5CE30_AMBAR|nr:hypothetical protein M8C21_029314 [Ambrosia artemisiifolia]
MSNQPTMASSKSLSIPVQVKTEPDLNEYSSKKRKDNSQSVKDWNRADEVKSCPKCHRNLLVPHTKRSSCPVCCKDIEPQLKGSTADLQDQFTNVAAGDRMNVWISEPDDPQNTNIVALALAPSLNHPPATKEDPKKVWRENAVGQLEKEMFQAIEDRYPQTFQRVQIIEKPYWLSTLKNLYDLIKSFMQKSVHDLEEDELTDLEVDINFFETMMFDLSWARNRLHMVRDLKFGNDPLRLELVEATTRVERAWVEFEKAQLEYRMATDARNKKLHEIAYKYGFEYDDVLNGTLGFGMLPEY